MVFGSINVRSIANKLDDLLEVRRDLLINVLFVVQRGMMPIQSLCVAFDLTGFKSLIDLGLDWRLTTLYRPTTAAWLLLVRPEFV